MMIKMSVMLCIFGYEVDMLVTGHDVIQKFSYIWSNK